MKELKASSTPEAVVQARPRAHGRSRLAWVAIGLTGVTGTACALFEHLYAGSLSDWPRLLASIVIATVAAALGTGWVIWGLRGGAVDHQSQGERLTKREAQQRDVESALDDAQERLAQAHRLEGVGRLAGSVAHDFNNTLTVILSYGDLLRSKLQGDPATIELADQIIRAAEQGADLTKQLLTFSRRQMIKPRNLELSAEITKVERTLERILPSHIELQVRNEEEGLHLRADPTQLQHAILNLVLNARDAMPNGGQLVLKNGSTRVAAGAIPSLLAGVYVAISVQDEGTGMSPATMERIFEPFFTTKEPGLGTGLGLANVREMARALGGEVTVESELGKGSTFTLYVPRAEGRASGVEARLLHHHSSSRSVLVVDDEPQVCEVIAAVLSEHGYEVHLARDAATALAILDTTPVDLVCVDLVMPGVSGTKLIAELRIKFPLLPVLVCSAYGADEAILSAVSRGELSVLTKPFSREPLIQAVASALRKAPSREQNGSAS